MVQRFGLDQEEPKTLEAIGRKYDITRERVRQIEEDGLKKTKSYAQIKAQKVFQHFFDYLKSSDSLRREDVLLSQLGGKNFQKHVLFLLTLGEQFDSVGESEDFYSFWTIDKNSLGTVKKAVSVFLEELKKTGKPVALSTQIPSSYLEVSKRILRNFEGFYGLKEWPEINPRNIKDRAYIVFKKENRPLHFTAVAQLISKETSPQTVHNELIKDSRFVLVGRGLYALGDWGYESGTVKEVIFRVLQTAGAPLLKEEIIKEALKQRLVQENTILLNLHNRRYFARNAEGKYTIKEA